MTKGGNSRRPVHRRLWIPFVAVVLTVVALSVALGPALGLRHDSSPGASLLTVHFIDVDQGDATLIQGEDVVILIDAGRHDRNDVVPYLRSVGVTSIDLLVGTHPHADHIGQFPSVLREFDVKEVWLSGDETTTRTFENAIDAILASDAAYHEPRAGEQFQFGSVTIEVIHPEEINGDLNNGSIGLRLKYGDVAFLFTGDAEAEAELSMIARGHDLRADVLHVGHHGSRTSSSRDFLVAVNPRIAVYSAGKDNSYGHPHREVLALLSSLGINVYGTDVHGTIKITTDGKTIRVKTEKDGASTGPCGPGQVDINTAPADELVRIIHVGPALAGAIISGRPYSSVDDLIRVSGIGEARLQAIKDQGIACAGAA